MIDPFHDNLGSVAGWAAVELDMIRLGRLWETRDWNVRILGGWLADVARAGPMQPPWAILIVDRALELWQPDRPARRTVGDVRAFADAMSADLFQAISMDPTLSGLPRRSVMGYCLELAKLARADPFYSRNGCGRWRRFPAISS